MIADETAARLIAVLAAYLIGAISTAFLVTRALTGKDIRRLGSGNVGANNTFREVGPAAGIAVGVIDIAKGAGAVAVSHWLLGVPFFEAELFVLLAGAAAVAGHVWPIYLRFRGGNGLAPTIGALALVLPRELLVAIGLILLLIALTRNVVLSANLGLLSVPISAWLFERGWLYVTFSLLLTLMLTVNFIPTARTAVVRAGGARNLLGELLRRHRR